LEFYFFFRTGKLQPPPFQPPAATGNIDYLMHNVSIVLLNKWLKSCTVEVLNPVPMNLTEEREQDEGSEEKKRTTWF
jgi:hypothetical protein